MGEKANSVVVGFIAAAEAVAFGKGDLVECAGRVVEIDEDVRFAGIIIQERRIGVPEVSLTQATAYVARLELADLDPVFVKRYDVAGIERREPVAKIIDSLRI